MNNVLQRRWWLALLLTVVALSSMVGGCGSPKSEPVAAIKAWKKRDIQAYVGSSECRECHEAIYDRYQSHPMAQAMSLAASDEDAIEDFAAGAEGFVTPASRKYTVVKQDGVVTHHEIGIDPATGAELFDNAQPIAYAIGSGARGRTYVTVEEGRLYESPISWYSSTQSWDLSPGYLPDDHPRFNREIGTRCLGCHCGLPAETIGGSTEFGIYPEPHVLEYGIGCERCHGAGKDHIAFHRSTVASRRGADPIVNPTKLDPERRDDACNQCHLLGEDTVLREGRRNEEFRPGDRLGDVWSVFVRGTDVSADGSTKAVSHVQQMHSSRCYVASSGAMGCVSCHDPHGLPSEDQVVNHYRQSCLKCHEGQAECSEPEPARLAVQPDDSCVACHMPKLEANDIPHTSQTDHRVLRRPAPEQRAPKAARATVDDWVVFGDKTLDWTEQERNRALGISWAVFAADAHDVVSAKRAIELLEPLVSVFPSDAEIGGLLAYCWFLNGDRAKAFAQWDQVLAMEPRFSNTHRTLATIHMTDGSLGPARDHLQIYLEQMPRDVSAIIQMSLIESKLLNDAEALKWAERARELDPGSRSVERWYAELTKGKD